MIYLNLVLIRLNTELGNEHATSFIIFHNSMSFEWYVSPVDLTLNCYVSATLSFAAVKKNKVIC